MVGDGGGVAEVVEDNPDRRVVVVGEFAHEVEDLGLVAQVEVVGRFVEEEDPGVLGQAGGQPHALKFPAGELVDGTLGHVRGAGEGKRLVDRRVVGLGERGEALAVRVPAVGDDVVDAHP